MAGQTGSPVHSSYQAIISHTYAVDTTPIDLTNLGALAHTAQVQYQRQLKTLQALQKQAELTADHNAAWRERERRREEKLALIDQERQAQQDQRAEVANRVAEARAARYDAAVRHEESLRAAAAAKVQAVEDRLARFMAERGAASSAEARRVAAAEARREATYRNNLALLEGRRQALLARERKVEDLLKQRDELRQLQLRIRAEEESLREHQRRAIKQRAETDLGTRLAAFHARNVAKDEYTARRRQELERLRRVRAEELRQRFEYIAAQANEAAVVAEAERQALAGRLSNKAARGEALAAQRQALLDEMQALRQHMQRQEDVIRAHLLRMRQQGSTALPEEVVRSLDALQAGGPLRATALLGGGRGGSGGSGFRGPAVLEAAPASATGTPRGAVGGGGGSRGKARPRSAAAAAGGAMSTPRGAGRSHVGGSVERPYVAAMLSPRVGQPSRVRRLAAAAGRPLSASAADLRQHKHHASPASPVTPTRATTAAATPNPTSATTPPPTIPGPSPYGPYVFPLVPKPRGGVRQPSVEEQVAAATRTDDLAAQAAGSGRYSGVHEVARPGSRREEELRGVLQEEIAKEAERQALLAKVTDDAERTRLIKYFTMEREEAKRRILALSNAAQAALYP